MPVANLGLGLIIFIVFVLSVVYGESIFKTMMTFVFAVTYIGIGIWGIANRRSKK